MLSVLGPPPSPPSFLRAFFCERCWLALRCAGALVTFTGGVFAGDLVTRFFFLAWGAAATPLELGRDCCPLTFLMLPPVGDVEGDAEAEDARDEASDEYAIVPSGS